MEIIKKYFPDLSEKQQAQFAMLKPLYEEWNEKINVISRKDVDNFYERHVLHSLAICKVIQFLPQSKIIDLGTGGGFPGIPLAIMYPEVEFHLVDSIGKKIKVVEEVTAALQLPNVTFQHTRVEDLNRKCDFVVSRAVAPLIELNKWTRKLFEKKSQHTKFANGIMCLKGGDLIEEISQVNNSIKTFPLTDFFKEEFFETKKIVYMKAMSL